MNEEIYIERGVSLADAAYEICKARARSKGIPCCVTISIIEKRLGLKPGKLKNYRANRGLNLKNP